ncbi:uncharacterized protein LOC133285366 [Gastrolobium bilobum]|uniref:uncharacterized protein LOC133285366 n=1 Tax=Gastrolobium bilobum TaxID=150636 RepID=UPI002AB2AEA4|nr:uncharacterized protein LOC133285366 [Gastrolobium bilobum]
MGTLNKKFRSDMVVLMEPRISGSRAASIIRSLGFEEPIVEETVGFSGGIWVLWNNHSVSVNLVEKSSQFVMMQISIHDRPHFLFMAIYASPRIKKRLELWEDLRRLQSVFNEPWLLAGDWNKIISAGEKKGGAPVDINRCKAFESVLEECNLINLGGSGPIYTWKGPKFAHLDRVYKRLDRAVANAQWRTTFDEATVQVIPRTFSDHNPLLLSLWNDSKWNTNVFGIISTKKSSILRRLAGIQRALERGHNWHLELLERNLRTELESILDMEEQLWYHKARAIWIRDGDRNTKFYHTTAITRRRRNSMRALKNDASI